MQPNETERNPKGAGRKGKQNLEWIGVSCNQDRNLQLLTFKFGIFGLGFYIELRRRIGANREGGYFLKFTADDFEMFCAEARIDEDSAKGMLDFCFSKGMFDKNLYDQHNILTGVDSAVNWCESAKERQSFAQGIIAEYFCIDIVPYLEYNAKKFAGPKEEENKPNEDLISDTVNLISDTRNLISNTGNSISDPTNSNFLSRSKEKYNEVKKEEKKSEAKKSETKRNNLTPTEFKNEVFMDLVTSFVQEQLNSQGSFSTQNTDIQEEIAQIEDAKVVNLHKNHTADPTADAEKEKSSAKKEKAKIPHPARLGIIQMFENQTGVPFVPGKESNSQMAHICRTLDAYLLKANGFEPPPEMVLQLYHDLWAMKPKLKPFLQESLYSISGTAKFLPEMLSYLNGKMVIENVEANKKPTKIMKMNNLANEFMNMKTSQMV